MTIFDFSTDPDEYQLFKFNVEQKHIDKCRSDQSRSPIEFALMDFLRKYGRAAQLVLRVDEPGKGSSLEGRKYRTEIKGTAFQYPAFEEVDGIHEGTFVGFQHVELIYDDQLNTWLNRLNQSLKSNSKLPDPIVVQLKIKVTSPRGELSLVHSKTKRANELEGTAWLKNSISIWNDLRKSKEEARLGHPAMFPADLAQRLIECFTNEAGRLILDPFVGVGSTLVAAKTLGKDAVGIEISPEFAALAEDQVNQTITYSTEKTDERKSNVKVHVADSRELDKYIAPQSVDMVITSPPYWDILLEKRTADSKEQRDYGDAAADIGKIRDYKKFLLELRKVFDQVYHVMKPKSYCCIIVMDLRKKNRFYPYHMQVTQFMEEIGFTFDDMIIWDRGQEYNNLRPLGYPTVFRVNRIHEFILIFQKPSECIQ